MSHVSAKWPRTVEDPRLSPASHRLFRGCDHQCRQTRSYLGVQPSGRTRFWSESCRCSLVGRSRSLPRRGRYAGHAASSRRGGKIEGKRIEIVDANGAIVPVSLSAAIITDGGIEVGTVGVFTDLREKMRMEQRLSQAQQKLILQERQAFVASLAGATAHELNQPLQSVMAYTAMIKRRAEKEGIDLGAPVEVILRETERMAEIVKKVGRITKYETKRYVGGATILDFDASSGTPMDGVAALDVGPLSERKAVIHEAKVDPLVAGPTTLESRPSSGLRYVLETNP